MEKQRLSKILAQKGICSRREADRYIEAGYIFVDGLCVTTLGTKVCPESKITFSKEFHKKQSRKVTIILNKPVGYVSNLPEDGYKEAVSLITKERQDPKDSFKLDSSHFDKLSVAGRLDINSKGLLVLTQDGAVAKTLIQKDSDIEKEYFVRVDKPFQSKHKTQLESGLELDGKPLKPAKVRVLTETTFVLILKEGKKRQIRRMCELIGLMTCELKRVRIGKIRLGGLKPGTWRALKESESFL